MLHSIHQHASHKANCVWAVTEDSKTVPACCPDGASDPSHVSLYLSALVLHSSAAYVILYRSNAAQENCSTPTHASNGCRHAVAISCSYSIPQSRCAVTSQWLIMSFMACRYAVMLSNSPDFLLGSSDLHCMLL